MDIGDMVCFCQIDFLIVDGYAVAMVTYTMHENQGCHFSWCQNYSENNLQNNDSIFTNNHYNDVIMGATTSQITSLAIIYSTVYSGTNQRKHQSSASLAFVWVIHRGPVNSPHKWPVTRKVFPFDDVIMMTQFAHIYQSLCCRCTYYKYSHANTIKTLRLRCCYHVSLHKIYIKILYKPYWT